MKSRSSFLFYICLYIYFLLLLFYFLGDFLNFISSSFSEFFGFVIKVLLS